MPFHVVVTGASAGIGAAIAREYAAQGASVTLVARRRALLEPLAASLAVPTHVVAADLSDLGNATVWLAEAEAALGPVDVLVNNAGVQIVGHSVDTELAAAEALLAVDLLAPLRLCLAVLPGMLARRRGCIVNVCSMAALAPTPGMFYYCAAKGGLASASEALRGELGRSGVHVLTVYPGPVHSDMEAAARAKFVPSLLTERIPTGDPAVLARRIRRAAERRQARVIYPRFYHLARWFPGVTAWVLARFTPALRPELTPPSSD
ncbi:MAG: SDR family NAD(P)-dependent oxidoreductase [Nannocystis sp.]|uniref:SDR family NAD(P)-dependent oxidoreductase n=1 Tax=Nannocystis sp. TaxID=1962667 RepID=UPI0024233C41|nr:SDR family NAD(P)-dependent oxidoreductase [Nannocystis sp.]MBK9755042.1 SDR family NAD(P)-dependent oxidoreductase [Nannocystis sp.]